MERDPHELEKTLARFRRRVAAWTAVSSGLRALVGWGFLWGTGVLVARWTFGDAPAALRVGAAGVLAAAVLGVYSGLRSRPRRAAALAFLDRRERRGGLLMVRDEADLGAWDERLEPSLTPRVSWHPGSLLPAGAAAAIYAVAALLLPITPAHEAMERRLEIDGTLRELAEDVQLLEEQGWIEEERAEELEQEIERLEQEASGSDPAAAWEALDHVQEEAERAAREAAEEAQRTQTALDAATTVTEALPEAAKQDGQLAEAAAQDVAELLHELQKSSSLDPETAQALAELAAEQGAMTEEGAAALLAALGAARGQLEGALRRLRLAGLVDEAQLRNVPSAEEADAALLTYLEQQGHGAAAAACKAAGVSSPGSRGINRGPGHVELTWKDPASRQGTSFEEEVLPPTGRLDRSQVLAADRVTPEGLEAGATSSHRALRGAEAGRGSAETQVLLPRHRGAVRRYFDRTGEEGDP